MDVVLSWLTILKDMEEDVEGCFSVMFLTVMFLVVRVHLVRALAVHVPALVHRHPDLAVHRHQANFH